MRRLVLAALLAGAATMTHGQTFSGTKLAGVQVSTAVTGPVSGIFFSPVAGHYGTTQSISLTSVPSPGISLLYTSDGSTPTEASTSYSTAISAPANVTLNALAITTPTVLAQSIQQCTTSACWKTQLSCTTAQCAPYVAHYSTPGYASCPTAGGCGVSGIPTAVTYAANIASPSLSGNATHLSFETQNISGAGSQTQALWANVQGAANNATYQVQDFYMYPGENEASIWALESDLVLWDGARHLIKSGALQCLLKSGTARWQYNGQSGGWQEFGGTTSVFKNGVLVSASPKITQGCSSSMSTWVHVQYHVTFNPGVNNCTDRTTGLATECIYIDYLTIDNDKYTFGTTTTTDAAGNTITVSALKVVAADLPAGYPQRCFNQLQIDTAGTGASPSTPITYGMYYDKVNMSCGSGSPNATGSAAYTIP